jgi:Lhr-like helicase
VLFTRFHESRVRELETQVAALKAQAEAIATRESQLLQLLQREHETFAALANTYREGLERARKIQEDAERALQSAVQAAPAYQNRPLHMSEEEEDLEWQRENGIVNQAEMEDLLREAGLNPHLERL